MLFPVSIRCLSSFAILYKSTVQYSTANCRPTDDQLSADCRPTVGRQLTDSRPTGFLGSSSSQLPKLNFFFCRHHLPSLDIIYPHYTLFAFAKHHLLLLHVIDRRSTSFSVFTCYLPSLYVFTFTRNHLSTAHIFCHLT